MYNYKLQTKEVTLNYLSKKTIEQIEEQLSNIEDDFGVLNINIVDDDILRFEVEESEDGSYKVIISIYDLISEGNDFPIVRIKFNNIDEQVAYQYAIQMKKYIKVRVLDNYLGSI